MPPPPEGDNVVPIGSAKAKRQKAPRAPSSGKSKDRVPLYMMIASAMGNHFVGSGVPFGEEFKVIVDAEGVRRPVQILDDKVVVNVHEKAVKTAIIRYAHIALLQMNLSLHPSEANAIYDLWAALETPIKEDDILPVAEKSNVEKYTWRRLPWDIVDDGAETPTFDEMMARTGNADALMAWVGGLFLDKSDRQQYVYLHGEGQNGKGRLAAFLARVFGAAYRSEFVSGKPNNFWSSGLLGSRLVVFPDFDNPEFPNTGFFKSLTGDDAVRIEKKGMQPFTTNLLCKFMFLSNDKPALSESVANRRRAIYCHMLPIPGETVAMPAADYGARLWAEGPSWLARCVALYKKMAGHTSRIPTADEGLTDVIDSHEEPLLDLVRRWFVVKTDGQTTTGEMQDILRREGYRAGWQQRAVFAFLERRYGVRKVQTRVGEARDRVYRGIVVSEAGKAALVKM